MYEGADGGVNACCVIVASRLSRTDCNAGHYTSL